MLLWWSFPHTMPTHRWLLGSVVGLLLSANGLGGLVYRWYWRRNVERLQVGLSPTLARLGLEPPLAIFSGYGIRLAFVESERAGVFELLAIPRSRAAALHLVQTTPGFSLSEATIDVWCAFARPDLVATIEHSRGTAFDDRVACKRLGSVVLRAKTLEHAIERVLELVPLAKPVCQ